MGVKRTVSDVVIVWSLVAVALGIGWWMWSNSHQQVVPTDASLVECGKCLDQCKLAIDKHAAGKNHDR